MAINRTDLLADILLYLPDSNVLTDTQILQLAERVISDVGDDASKHAEVLCKSLKVCGQVNLSKHSVDGASIRQEKLGDEAYTYNTVTARTVWKDFISSLKDLCPMFGYVLTDNTSGVGMKISPSKTPIINDCSSDIDDSYL